MTLLLNNQRNKAPNWFLYVALTIFGLLVMAVLSSCSCEWHANRIEKKCGGSALSDTLLVHDTFITRSVQRDTVFKYFQHDSVIVREGKLTMKYFYNSHDSTVFLSGKCAADTIYKEIRVPYEKIVIEDNWFMRHKWWLVLFSVLGLGLAFLLRRK